MDFCESVPVDTKTFNVLAQSIGSKTTIPGWPSSDLDGLVKALKTWTLDPSFDGSRVDPSHPHAAFSKPFRCLAWGNCQAVRVAELNWDIRYIGTKPLYPDHPEAVSFLGNFLGYSFVFRVETDDAKLIAYLDGLIAENMAQPEYQAAKERRKSY